MNDDLTGRVALVTGASRGVGRAVAIALARQGASVACVARSTDASPGRFNRTIDETVREIEAAGGRAIAVPTNLAHDSEVQAMITATGDELGPVDILVNNAVVQLAGDLALPMPKFDLTMQVNVRAPLIAIREVMTSMRERGGGRILNVSSRAATTYIPNLMAYGMSKVALEHLTISTAEQLRPHHIAVNCFRIDTPVASELLLQTRHLIPRTQGPDVDTSTWDTPDIAARGIVWMISQPSSYTGHVESMVKLQSAGIMPRTIDSAHPEARATRRPSGPDHEP